MRHYLHGRGPIYYPQDMGITPTDITRDYSSAGWENRRQRYSVQTACLDPRASLNLSQNFQPSDSFAKPASLLASQLTCSAFYPHTLAFSTFHLLKFLVWVLQTLEGLKEWAKKKTNIQIIMFQMVPKIITMKTCLQNKYFLKKCLKGWWNVLLFKQLNSHPWKQLAVWYQKDYFSAYKTTEVNF